MQKGKKEKVNNISDILEEIVRCVTAPSFCVMPWKCVTMAVGDRTDPLVKKSVVHIYRTCVDGQNIFQIKVHNCKKEVCDHTICTKDCDTTQQTNSQTVKEAAQNEINKKKRKKRNKYFDMNKETTIGCCMGNNAIVEERVPSLKDSKRNSSTNKNKRGTKKSENNEKPSCTLQIFADGKSRKLNFQLHPAMKVFLGKALDRIEGHDAKGRRTSSPSSAMPERGTELLGRNSDTFRSNMAKNLKQFSSKSQSYNKNIRTESVEEFEISLPDNTSHAKDMDDLCATDSIADLLKSCNCEGNYVSDKIDNEICPELKINDGYLLHNIIPEQQFWNRKGKSDEETHAAGADLPHGRTSGNCQNQQLTTDNTLRITNAGPASEPHHGELNYNHSEQRFHSSDLRHVLFHSHQANNYSTKYDKSDAKSNFKQILSDSSRNNSSWNENLQTYPNPLQCFQNITRDNLIRTPYIVDYRSDNNELLINDIRNLNNRNYTILENRAPMHSTEYINNPSIYRNNASIYSPPIAHETSFSPEYGQIISNGGDRFYGVRHYDNFPEHRTDFINMRAAPPQHYKTSYNQHDVRLPKQHTDFETPIFHEKYENSKESRIFNHYNSTNSRNHSDKTMFFMESNHDPIMHLEEVPTNDRSHNIINDQITNVNYCKGTTTNNNTEGKRSYNCPRCVRDEDATVDPEVSSNHRSNEQIKRKGCKESDKSSSNRENRKQMNSIATQYYNIPSNSTVISSSITSNKQDKDKIKKNNEKHSNQSNGRNRRFNRGSKKNRRENSNAEENQVLHNADPELINNPKIHYENEEERFFERLENLKTFKHIKPSKIASEEKVNNRIKRNNKKIKTLNRNISKQNAISRREASKESNAFIKRDESTDTTDSSVFFAENIYVNNADEKSSDTSSCYSFPDCSNYHFFKPYPRIITKKLLSREIANKTNERLYEDEYNSNSHFFCYPSHISWDHYDNLHQMIPNLNQKHFLQDEKTKNEIMIEPITNGAKEGDSSKLCGACSKALNEEKSEVKYCNDSYANKYETSNNGDMQLIINNLQQKDMENLRELYCSKNNLEANKDELSCNASNINFDQVSNPINFTLTSGANDNNKNVERNDMKINIVHSKDLKELNPILKCDNLKKKPSKMLHPESVKKFFSHAKDYLNIRKYSTSSLKSNHSNGVLQKRAISSINHSDAELNKVENHLCVDSRNLTEASDNKRNDDCLNVNRTQCDNHGARVRSENSAGLPKSGDIEGSLSTTLKQSEVFRNSNASGHNYSDTKSFKPSTNTQSRVSLKDEKYRLYGSNLITTDYMPMEDFNKKLVKNEFKILETESECEGFSDDEYYYSSSEWQSEVAKNWVGRTKKIHKKQDNRVKVSLKRNKSKSFNSLQYQLSKCYIEKESKCNNFNNKPMINATIALSPDKKTRKENRTEVEDQYQVNHYSKQKSEQKFSNLFSSSIKNNYKKIKGLVKRNQENKKAHEKKSPIRVPILKSPSFTETQSLSYLTPITSTYITSKSGDSIFLDDNPADPGRICNESTNTYTSESNFAKSDPIIRKIEPGTWQKFVSRKVFPQTSEISETENIENSSLSDFSIGESVSQVSSNHRLKQTFGKARGLKNTQKISKKNFTESGPNSQRREAISNQPGHQVPSESMDEYNQSDESEQNDASNCFENPIVDPKTGFRPLVPT